MPCNSDYLAPTGREKELRRSAVLLKYVKETLSIPVDLELKNASEYLYGGEIDYVPELCSVLRCLKQEVRDSILFAHNKTARDLANWWEDHEAADRKREREEQMARNVEAIRKSALKKLTTEERAVFGVYACQMETPARKAAMASATVRKANAEKKKKELI